mmetsp:Transcript_32270/g.108700  ORF Transcript_32270/g.108700 Transcript_32270/m.108700 type:complete len:259 (+) Transcript_32270:1161-1937(+)
MAPVPRKCASWVLITVCVTVCADRRRARAARGGVRRASFPALRHLSASGAQNAGRSASAEKKQSWSAAKTFCASSSWTTSEMLTLEAPCESISTSTPMLCSTAKTRAMRYVDCFTSAMKDTMLRLRWMETCAILARSPSASFESSCFLSSVSETETSDVATTSTETPSLSKTPKTPARNPGWPSIRRETMSTSVMFLLVVIATTMDVLGDLARSPSIDSFDAISVPGCDGLYEFFTRTGVLKRSAGCIEIGCSTWAPK